MRPQIISWTNSQRTQSFFLCFHKEANIKTKNHNLTIQTSRIHLKGALPSTQVLTIAYIYKSETHYTDTKCTPMPGRKDGLCDGVEGGPNTSALMTPRWDHLFSDKKAQGWEKERKIRRPGDVGRGGSR